MRPPMRLRHPSIILLAIAWVIAGCRNKKEIEHARKSVYDADFAVVYAAALDATREQYASLDDFPATGTIKTAWHQVSYSNSQDDLANTRTLAQNQAGGMSPASGTTGSGIPTRLAYKRYFIRFDITVSGGRPWRVKVVGHAAEWEPGNALPVELKGMTRPPWLDGRTESLQVAIYRRIKAHARPMKEKLETKPDDQLPKTDPRQLGGIPPKAAGVLANIKDAIERRDYAALRAMIADDVMWSLGGAPGADTALAMWQADPATLDAMAALIAAGCAGDAKRVACPGGAPVVGAWQLIVEQRGDAWNVTSFIKAE